VAISERTDNIKMTGRPAYLQISDQLRSQIKDGAMPPGTLLPSTAQLGSRYDVSASVVKSAISVLRSEGLVVGQQGKGVYVRTPEDGALTESTDDDQIVIQLTEIRSELRVLADRMATLEAKVFPTTPRTPTRGK
jgi:GntR family transcriptional regulator